MNKIIEKEIVESFVIKSKQERILWELGNTRKRESVIWHFSGTSIFKPQCLKPLNNMSKDVLIKYLLDLRNTKNVYYLGESHIGELPILEAAAKACCGERCVLYLGDGIGYYQGEEDRSNTPRFLLKRQ